MHLSRVYSGHLCKLEKVEVPRYSLEERQIVHFLFEKRNQLLHVLFPVSKKGTEPIIFFTSNSFMV